MDTLRDEECPICGEATSYDGNECMICGFVQPPKEFQDPDLELAQKLDLRKDDADPNGMDVSDVGGIEDSINDMDRDGFDDETGEPMDGDPEMGQDPDLVCPVCGEGFSSKPTSVSMENPMADSMGEQGPDPQDQDPEQDQADDADPDMAAQEDDNAAEGDPCPACGQGVLAPPGEAQTEMGEDPEAAAVAGAPGSGDPTVDPDADPDDPGESDEADPHKSSDNPFADDAEDPDEDDDNGDGIPDKDEDTNEDGVPDDQEDDDDSAPPFESDDSDDDEDEDDPKKPAGHTPWQR